MAFNINPPVDIESLFGTWLAGVEHNTAVRIRIGICALLWAIWNCRNDMIFNRQNILNFLQASSEIWHGSVRGRYTLLRTPGSLWLLGATVGRW